MVKGTFGIVMSYYRDKYGLQQNAIYEGICSAASYFRAETEERNVDFAVIETLLARIGKEPSCFEFVLRDEDYKLWVNRLEIQSALAGRNLDRIRKKVTEYRAKMPRENKLHEQFCRYYECKLAKYDQIPADILCKAAWKALSMTKEKEDIPHRHRNLYTYMEMDLLLTLIHYRYGRWGNYHNAKACLLGMIDAVEIWTSPEMRAAVEGMAWIELLELTEQSNSDTALSLYVEQAITCLSKSDKIGALAEARFIKAKLLWRTRENAGAEENRILLSMEECRMAYAIFRALGWERERRELEDYCREEMQWLITMQTE